jgi:glycosyltransferase involved in cell wall biosynthesis
MSRLRVLMVSAFPRGLVRGGIEAAALQLVDALGARDDVELHVAALHPSVTRGFDETRGAAWLHWLPRWQRFSTLHMLTLAAAQVSQLERRLRPDVLHAQGPTPLSVAGLFSRSPFVLTVHGLEMLSPGAQHLRAFSGPTGSLRRRLAAFAMDLSVKRSDGIILISPYVKQLLGTRLASKAHIAIDNPVAEAFFDTPPAVGGGCLLGVGNLSELKNQLLLVRAFARVASGSPTWRLVLAGPPADRHYQARVEALVGELGLVDQIHLQGEASPSEVLDLYAHADAVLLGSVQETAPLAIAQAMAAARPVVATDVGGVRWMVQDLITGFIVPSEDEAAMAEALGTLIANPARRQHMGESARALALERFRPRQVAEKTTAFYRQVVEIACAS